MAYRSHNLEICYSSVIQNTNSLYEYPTYRHSEGAARRVSSLTEILRLFQPTIDRLVSTALNWFRTDLSTVLGVFTTKSFRTCLLADGVKRLSVTKAIAVRLRM